MNKEVLLNDIWYFEQNRYKVNLTELNSPDTARVAKEIFRKMERDKDISFSLKKRIFSYMDLLLEQGTIEAWKEILLLYQFLEKKEVLVNEFWEFSVLKTMLNAFETELNLHYKEERPISLLKICNMEELMETYFRVVFLLRRIEYDVEPISGTLCELMENRISPATVWAVLKDARIFHREKVARVIKGWEESKDG